MRSLKLSFAALLLMSGVAIAQEHETAVPPAPSGASNGLSARQFSNLRQEHAFGKDTYSAYSRNVGPGSVVDGYPENPEGNANSGLPSNPRAPAATNVNGGGGQ